jgi:hypothetical protein
MTVADLTERATTGTYLPDGEIPRKAKQAQRRPRKYQVREVELPTDRILGAAVTNKPSWQCGQVVAAYSDPLIDQRGDQYTPAADELSRNLKSAMDAVAAGSIGRLEELLLAQAHALQAIFTSFAIKAAGPWSSTLTPAYLAIAFRAQAQSRATLTALADLKYPRQPNFIGQQNVAVNQQVNNSAPAGSQQAESMFPQSRLLERGNGD